MVDWIIFLNFESINKTTNIMKTLRIKTADFINWYYNSGADQDQEDMALN